MRCVHDGFVNAVQLAYYLSPLFQFKDIVEILDFSLRIRVLCHSAISRIFTSTNISPKDDLYFTLGIFGRITRIECRRTAGNQVFAFASALV